MTATIEIAIIEKYSPVRIPIVDGSPIEGGLAGYFRSGTR